jgi:4-hydroxy-tetrahydrodipicolinate reductase
MGRTIEGLLLERGHTVAGIIDRDNQHELRHFDATRVDVAIEFTEPSSAIGNITHCLHRGIPIVSGTTGWLSYRTEIERMCTAVRGSFFYASNYSIGVNIFFALNKKLAELMRPHKGYEVAIEEIHHLQKKDAPSGTAITLAEGIVGSGLGKQGWELCDNGHAAVATAIPIKALREEGVPGTHTIRYHSDIDTIEITHTAHSRQGFALGAIMAAEWLPGKRGVFGMEDLLQL